MTWLERLGRRRSSPAADDSPRRLLVDVSTIAQHDAGTGIQRVVRGIWQHLYKADLGDVALVPVAATARRGYGIGAFDPVSGSFSLPDPGAPLLKARAGDMFLGLDLAAHRLARHERQLARWRRAGASINLVVYDLLPLQRPDWFPDSTGRNFRKWMKVLMRRADRAICISGQVSRDLAIMLEQMSAPRRHSIERHVMPLSGAMEQSGPTMGLDSRGRDALDRMEGEAGVLMVGTIEPRKGHDCLIAAMEYLWASEADAPPLVIVGRPGWRTEPLQAQMRELETREPRFLWLDNDCDELLAELYGRAALVAVPSRGEGFGLPIVEALRHGRKILARDIPVFRELAQPGLSYFDDETPPALAARLQEVLQKPDPAPVTGAGWDVSAEALLRALGIKIDPPAVSRSS